MKHFTQLLCILLLTAASAAAQMTITNVTNAANRQPRTSRFAGVAQGALFVVVGRNLGPAEFQRASFPLPTLDGLAGVTVQASVGGATVDCILVSVSATEVAAILPSATPIGTGTVTVNNNGATATGPIVVVASAFGIFTYRNTTHTGLGLVYNVSGDDGSTTLNTTDVSAPTGGDILVNGTGLGAITSDETQSGVTDVPNTTIRVYVGIQPATVVSAGRGNCCDGLDPSYPVPPGIAAWDVIRFTVPDGVVGCYVPVLVQIGSFVSNLATISVAPGGGVCAPAVSTLPPELTERFASQTGVSIGALNLGRTVGINTNAAGVTTMQRRDNGNATFVRYPNLPASAVTADYKFPENVCQINGFPGPNGGVVVNGNEVAIVPMAAVSLDAGPSLTVKGPAGTRTILRRMAGMLFDYASATLGDTTPGNYLDPGHYTISGPSGRDVGTFTAETDVPSARFIWTSIPPPGIPIDRSKDLTIKWTGGIPGTQVTVLGGSLVNGVNSGFLCAASVDAGQLIIPSYVLLNLAPTGNSAVPGQLTLGNRKVSLFTASGLDLPSIGYSEGYTMFPKWE